MFPRGKNNFKSHTNARGEELASVVLRAAGTAGARRTHKFQLIIIANTGAEGLRNPINEHETPDR